MFVELRDYTRHKMTSLKDQAIHCALVGNWSLAITHNQELLKETPGDIETLNRLAFALTVTGKLKEAKSTYQKVLRIDDQNPIALKNLKRLSSTYKSSDSSTPAEFIKQADSMFLEESGKTKIVELVNSAEPKNIARLITGEPVTLRVKRLKVFVLDRKNQYLGMLPDNISNRLIKFIKGGNEYQACIKGVNRQKVNVFIRETIRVSKFKNQPSFVSGERSHSLLDKSHSYFTKQKQVASSESSDDQSDEEDESL